MSGPLGYFSWKKFPSSFVLFPSTRTLAGLPGTLVVTSACEQMIDRICVKVQDHLNSLRNCMGDAVQEDVKAAERLMRDAKNSKTVSFQAGCVDVLRNNLSLIHI